MGAMGTREYAFAPGCLKVALAIKDHHRMGAAAEDVDIVLIIDSDRANFAPLHARRHLGPAIDDLKPEVTLALNGQIGSLGHFFCSP